jgi:hypothetical protein
MLEELMRHWIRGTMLLPVKIIMPLSSSIWKHPGGIPIMKIFQTALA